MRWVGFLRNVMVGRDGLNRDVLLDVVDQAGGADPRSVLTTGNVLFSAPKTDIDRVVADVERAAGLVVGRSTPSEVAF